MNISFHIPTDQLAIRADPVHWQRHVADIQLTADHLCLQIEYVDWALTASKRHKPRCETLPHEVL